MSTRNTKSTRSTKKLTKPIINTRKIRNTKNPFYGLSLNNNNNNNNAKKITKKLNNNKREQQRKQQELRNTQRKLKERHILSIKKQDLSIKIQELLRPFILLDNKRIGNKLEKRYKSYIDHIGENIFNIDEKDFVTDTLCTAETKIQSYADFLRFSSSTITNIQKEIKESRGNIVDFIPVQSILPTDMEKLNTIKDEYSKLFSSIKEASHYKNSEGHIFPNYVEDMYNKYDENREGYIAKKDDAGMGELLNQRLKDLENCSTNFKNSGLSNNNGIIQDFYNSQLVKETLVKEEPNEIRCKNIHWGKKAYPLFKEKYYKNISLERKKEIDDFLKENNGYQNKLLKSFLDDSFFDGNGNFIIDKLSDILKENRRQYIFGFSNVILKNKFDKFRELYECLDMMFHSFYMCGHLTNWNLHTNLLFNYCATKRTDMLFPIRFTLDRNHYRYNEGTYDLISKRKEDPNIFLNSSIFTFLGIISIKYNYFNETSRKNELRLWLLFVFKPISFTKEELKNFKKEKIDILYRYFNSYNGMLPEYIFFSIKKEFIEISKIFTTPNITHIELKNFYKYFGEHMDFYRHIPSIEEKNEDVLFIRRKEKDSENNKLLQDKIRDLKLEKVKIEIIEKKKTHNLIKIVTEN